MAIRATESGTASKKLEETSSKSGTKRKPQEEERARSIDTVDKETLTIRLRTLPGTCYLDGPTHYMETANPRRMTIGLSALLTAAENKPGRKPKTIPDPAFLDQMIQEVGTEAKGAKKRKLWLKLTDTAVADLLFSNPQFQTAVLKEDKDTTKRAIREEILEGKPLDFAPQDSETH